MLQQICLSLESTSKTGRMSTNKLPNHPRQPRVSQGCRPTFGCHNWLCKCPHSHGLPDCIRRSPFSVIRQSVVREWGVWPAKLHHWPSDWTCLTRLHWKRMTCALGSRELSSIWMRRVGCACCAGWDDSMCRELVTWWRSVHSLIGAIFKKLSDFRRNAVVLCLNGRKID